MVCKIHSASQFLSGNILFFLSTGYNVSKKLSVEESWGCARMAFRDLDYVKYALFWWENIKDFQIDIQMKKTCLLLNKFFN